ncbi:MAG TPA: hypothetical protein PKE55_06235 [Kiritimatiellia bacterium]|nr:hypothetical protein [Kiritimatiellia bacterium]
MNSKIKDTQAQWDDVPGKVVGRRRLASGGWEQATILQHRVNEALKGSAGWPRGVVRFSSFEEADAWWIQKTSFRKR